MDATDAHGLRENMSIYSMMWFKQKLQWKFLGLIFLQNLETNNYKDAI